MAPRAVATIGFVLIGGEHQLLHIVPVAAALSRTQAQVELFAATPQLADAARTLMQQLGAGPFTLTLLHLPGIIEAMSRKKVTGSNLKSLRLLRHSGRMRRCRALVTSERTSTLLKRLPGRCPPMIHLRHGAGDRAVGFERRIALFDQLIVAGEKDRFRTISAGLLPAHRCHACGYIKLAALRQMRQGAAPLFDNDRPTVLYNPHFRPGLGSWQAHGRAVVEAIRASDEFNLVVAPHVRLFAGASAAERNTIEALEVPGRVIVDLGSAHSFDMTYTLGADIYLGDVSSQIYEFTAEPRPCVFLDSHRISWRGNPDYRMWEMGEVVQSPAEVLPALRRAREQHARYRDVQLKMTGDALGATDPDCAVRAAAVIEAAAQATSR